MFSCVGFLLRHGVMVSYLVVNIINIGFDLITLLNNKKKKLFCLVVPWGDIIVLR
jgi:hypothetical protein